MTTCSTTGEYITFIWVLLWNDGFIERTNELLFAKITNTHIYFIDVMEHGYWAEQRCMDIIHNNWPELIEHFRMKGVLPGRNFAADERITLRKSGISSPVMMNDGTVYAPPGFGLTTSGESTLAMLRTNSADSAAGQLEEYVRGNLDSILTDLQVESEQAVHLRLSFQNGQAGVSCETNKSFRRLLSYEDTCREFGMDLSGYNINIV